MVLLKSGQITPPPPKKKENLFQVTMKCSWHWSQRLPKCSYRRSPCC